MSKMKFKYNAVHTEKYTDKQTGEEKKKYTTIGAVFEREDGTLCMKLLDSWVNFYPPKAKAEDYKKLKENLQEFSEPQEEFNPVTGEISDEIPF